MRMLIVAAFLVVSVGAFAQPYKWVDSNGRIQYSEHPPTGVSDAQTVKRRIGTATGVPGADASGSAKAEPLTVTEQEQAFRKRRIEAQEKAQKQAKAEELDKEKRETCQVAERSLAGMESGGRMSRHTAGGEREFMNDTELAAEKDRTRKIVAASCN